MPFEHGMDELIIEKKKQQQQQQKPAQSSRIIQLECTLKVM